jgi:hypothetical protein
MTDRTPPAAPYTPLPGELTPLQWDGTPRPPVTAAEALGVARRLADRAAREGRVRSAMARPVQLPDRAALRVMSAHRLPPLVVMMSRGRAELEGRTLTDVIERLLEGYASSPPGTVARWVYPDDEPTAPTP